MKYVTILCTLVAVSTPAPAADAPAPLTFNRDIRPILAENCFACHGPDAQRRRGDLRVDQREAALQTGAIRPGDAANSLLVERILSTDPDTLMPPPASQRQLTASQKETLQRWIAAGAEYQSHWAYLVPVRPELPEVKLASWPRNAVDRFIQARLEQEGLTPSPEAERTALIRRVTLDLTGLPPTPAEVDAFLADSSADAYERVVARLLQSPHYGERMALDWLDAGRFADTNGYQVDRDREMYAWRDWVIAAFNRNLPFDQFTVEQIAGDLLPNATLEQRIATGFHRNPLINEEGGVIPEEFLAEYCADRVETTATVWLGQTLGCARCHDHKYDPFTQQDFYSLFAFFHNVSEQGIGNYGAPIRRNTPPMLRLPAPDIAAKLGTLNTELTQAKERLAELTAGAAGGQADWEAQIRAAKPADASPPPEILALVNKDAAQRTPAEQKQLADFRLAQLPDFKPLSDRVATLQKQISDTELQIPTTLVMDELPQPRPTFVLLRGAYDKQGEQVTAGTPASLPPLSPDLPRNRLGLARWLVAPANPLTARVTVNRYWQSLFGVGLVRTAEDFGSQGELPSHPELLDWLATEFQGSGWDVKGLLQLLVTSAAYRQSSRLTSALRERDPENRLLARGPRFRLQAELIRDQALAASGLLVGKIGGPSVRPYHPPGLYEQVVAGSGASTYVLGSGDELYRRSLYTYWKRSVPHPAMLVFDAPFRELCTVRRPRTNTPLQALNLMNDPTYVEAARFLAQRMIRDGGETSESRIRHGFRLVTARAARPAEIEILVAGLRRMEQDFQQDSAAASGLLKVGATTADTAIPPSQFAAYTTVAMTILNLDETVTKE